MTRKTPPSARKPYIRPAIDTLRTAAATNGVRFPEFDGMQNATGS